MRVLLWALVGLGVVAVSALVVTIVRRDPSGRVGALAPGYIPSWQFFSDGSHGIVVLEADGTCLSCQWLVERTDDGGRTWRRSKSDDEPRLPEESISNTYSVGIPRVAEEGAVAWGTRGFRRLAVTSDGGRTWRDVSSPCTKSLRYQNASNEPSLAAVSANDAWILCTASSVRGPQAKAVYVTSDGGRAWRRVAGVDSGGAAVAGHGLPTAHTSGFALSVGGSGFGVIVPHEYEGRPVVTRDGGRTWATISFGERVDSVWEDAEVSSGRDAYLLGEVEAGDRRRFTLYATHDRAKTWRPVRRWTAEIERND